jgi:hypothetical protein
MRLLTSISHQTFSSALFSCVAYVNIKNNFSFSAKVKKGGRITTSKKRKINNDFQQFFNASSKSLFYFRTKKANIRYFLLIR